MTKLSDENFKVAMTEMLQQAIRNMPETSMKIELQQINTRSQLKLEKEAMKKNQVEQILEPKKYDKRR